MQKKKTLSQQNTPLKLKGNEKEGLIIAHYGSRCEVETNAGEVIRCYPRKNLIPLITGDRVLFTQENPEEGTIVAALPRKTLLARPGSSQKIKPVAANIDSLIITSTPETLSEFLMDCYLVVAETLHITPLLLINKIDLLDKAAMHALQKKLHHYALIGYDVIYCSTKCPQGLNPLHPFLADKTSVFVGASGVGKSSIIGALQDQLITVGDVSDKGLGKHTTTSTRLYHLADGGSVIDSPGIREFSLWNMEPHDILKGFIEFKPFLDNQCRFRDCQHDKEPDCRLKKAVADHIIHPSRWQNFKKIIGPK